MAVDAVRTYRRTMEPPREPRAAPEAVGTTTAFVGRSAQFQLLEQLWEAVEDERRQVVVVGGAPGIGKTRLAAEAARALRRHGATVLWGACDADLEVPHRPFVRVLEQALADAPLGSLGGVPDSDASALLRLTGAARRHWPDALAPEAGEHESRPALFDAVLRVVVALTRQQPVVVVLEDLHWASDTTLALLSHVVQSTVGERLLVLVTARTTEPDRRDTVTFALADLHRLDGVERMDLDGLTTADVEDYLVAVAGASSAQARGAAPVLRERTGGNPFLLHEHWRDLAGRGGVDAVREPGATAPRSVQDALRSRLLALGPQRAAVVETAAVAGEVVDPAVLVAAVDGTPEEVLAGVDAAVGAGLLEPAPGAHGRHRFVHALARQAVLDGIPSSRRVQAHARVAAALEAVGDHDDPGLVVELAHHHLQSRALGDGSRAVHYLVLAARQAERSIAHAEAAARWEQAAQVRLAVGPPRTQLLMAAARCHMHAGVFARARELYGALAASEDPVVRLHAAVGYEDASWRPGLHGDRSLGLLQRALDGVPTDHRDPLQVRALASMGRAAGFTGDAARSRDVGDRALAAARVVGDPHLLADALAATLWQGMTPQLAPQLLARAVELHALGRTSGDDDHLGQSAFYRAVFGYILGDAAQWASAQRDLARLASHGGQPFFRYVAGCCRWAERYAAGDFRAAEHITGWLEELAPEFAQATEGSSAVQQFMLRRATGGLGGVRGLVTGQEDPAQHWLPGLLALYVALDMPAPATRALATLCDQLDDLRAGTAQWAGVLAWAAEAAVALGDTAAAARLRPLLAEHAGTNLVAGQFVAVFGSADRPLAQLDSLLGLGSADLHFERALEMDRRMGAVAHQAETLLAWSRHAASTGASGRSTGALAAEAQALARRVGHVAVLDALDGARGPHTARVLPRGLTERELDVLQLVAQGLSNREVGERLFISANTTANHVRSILMKTDSPNRTRAAVFAAEHGLLG